MPINQGRSRCHPNLLFFSSRRRHTRSVSAFLLNRSSDLLPRCNLFLSLILHLGNLFLIVQLHFSKLRSEERRVGKEGRSRGSPPHEKRKRNRGQPRKSASGGSGQWTRTTVRDGAATGSAK